MKLVFLFILSLLLFKSNAQINNVITNDIAAEKWLKNISSLPLDSQLRCIRERLIADTVVNFNNSYNNNPDYINDSSEKEQMKERIRERLKSQRLRGSSYNTATQPLLVVGGKVIALITPISSEKFSLGMDLINEKYISKVFILTGTAATALYGGRGYGGVVILYVNKEMSKKWNKRFKKWKKFK